MRGGLLRIRRAARIHFVIYDNFTLFLVYILLREPTSKKPCDKSLLIDYTTYENSFEMTAESNEGSASDASVSISEALRYSDDNGRGTWAREGEVITENQGWL